MDSEDEYHDQFLRWISKQDSIFMPLTVVHDYIKTWLLVLNGWCYLGNNASNDEHILLVLDLVFKIVVLFDKLWYSRWWLIDSNGVRWTSSNMDYDGIMLQWFVVQHSKHRWSDNFNYRIIRCCWYFIPFWTWFDKPFLMKLLNVFHYRWFD